MSDTRETRSTSHFARFWSLWIFCGSCVVRFVVFGPVWFFGSGLRIRSCSCGFCGSVVLPSMPMLARPLAHVVFVVRWSCHRCRCLRIRSCSCGFCGSVVLPSIPMLARPLAHVVFVGRWSCHRCRCLRVLLLMWTAKKICPSPHFVLCSVSSPLGATFTNGENDHG